MMKQEMTDAELHETDAARVIFGGNGEIASFWVPHSLVERHHVVEIHKRFPPLCLKQAHPLTSLSLRDSEVRGTGGKLNEGRMV